MKYNNSKKIAVFGNMTRDVFVTPSENKKIVEDGKEYFALPYGAKLTADKLEGHFGGACSSVSISFMRLGHQPFPHGSVGDDEVGGKISNNLSSQNIDISHLQVNPGKKSGFSIILNSSEGERTVIFTSEANKYLKTIKADDITKQDFDALYLGHLASLEDDEVLEQISIYLDKNPEIIFGWNPGSKRIKKGIFNGDQSKGNINLLSRCNYLFMNKEEATAFTRQSEIEDSAKVFLETGCEHVIVTDGGNGAWVFTNEEEFFFPPASQNKIDTLGAGDSFASAFFASRLHDFSLQKSGKYASMNAASVVSFIGAQDGLLTADALYKN